MKVAEGLTDDGQLWGATRPDFPGQMWPMWQVGMAQQMVDIYNAWSREGGAKLWHRDTPEADWEEVK
jgi:hypothetical protein